MAKQVHYLKILPEYFELVKIGKKTFEVRKNDRGFKEGDCLLLREWNIKHYTGRQQACEVIYILDNKEYCKEGYIIMGIRRI